MNKPILITFFLFVGFARSQTVIKTYHKSKIITNNNSKIINEDTVVEFDFDKNNKIKIFNNNQKSVLNILSKIKTNVDIKGNKYKEMIISDGNMSGFLIVYNDNKKGCLLVLEKSKWFF